VAACTIRSQCSPRLFLYENPIFEEKFSEIEGAQKRLLDDIIVAQRRAGSADIRPKSMSSCVMFSGGRNPRTAVANAKYLANQFGKPCLDIICQGGRNDLLAHLPQVEITIPTPLMDAVDAPVMYPLIDDLDCTLF